MYCSGNQVGLRGFPTAHQTPLTLQHIKGIVLVLCRDNEFPTLQTPLTQQKRTQHYLEQTASWC